jgi:hypothetical protein
MPNTNRPTIPMVLDTTGADIADLVRQVIELLDSSR